MRLRSITIQRFKNIVDPQIIEIEHDVTCFVGKNESGKTTILKALHRLNPANGAGWAFDVTTEYPRWRLARDRRTENLDSVAPISAEFDLEDTDISVLAGHFSATPPRGTVCKASRQYNNNLELELSCELKEIVNAASAEALVKAEDIAELLTCDSL